MSTASRSASRNKAAVQPRHHHDRGVEPHERKTAEALAEAGRTVEFIRRSEEQFATSADCVMDGMVWEMKSPKSGQLKRVQKTLREALVQSRNVILDSRRMKGLPDHAIERELRKWAGELKSLDRLVFVGRSASCLTSSSPAANLIIVKALERGVFPLPPALCFYLLSACV